MTGDRKYVSIRKAFLNLPTIVLVIALPIFFLNLNLTQSSVPAIQATMQFCQYFNNFNAPLPMLIMGIRLADVRFREVFNSGRVYLVSALKLLVFPLIALLLMWVINLIPTFNLDANLVTSILICVAMPTATMTMTFAEIFNGDKYTAVKVTLQTTLFSIITIPLFVTILSVMGFVGL
jgi:predicted permease